MTKVYKARYFPHTNFLSAKLGGSPSFVWRSILEAQNVIKEEVACRVDSGGSINVVKDSWLPDTRNPYVSSNNAALENMSLSSILIHEENRWDVDLLYELFNERDVNLILSIPINQSEYDVWYWEKERLGHYLVISAYVLIQELKNMNNAGASLKCWKRLRALKIPFKFKHFLWRAVSGCLPPKSRLQQKHVNIKVLYPICNQEIESVAHVLLNSSFANECWRSMGISIGTGFFY